MDESDGEHRTPDRRAFTTADATLRQTEEEGVFEVRMPIATTGEVRNQGDDPLTRDELSGMARQIDERDVPVFLDHGGTNLGGMERYSAVEKVGEWREGDVTTREEDGADQLVATARLMDPETLPNGVKDLRAHLGAIKEQVDRGFSLSSSIGWRTDDSYPGGVDLMEASIVGIGSDPRTTSNAEAAVVARAAVAEGVDIDDLVAAVRTAVEDGRPLGPPGDEDRFDTFDECVSALQEDEDLSEDEAERICGAWEQDKDDQTHDMTEDETETETEQDEQPDEERQAPEWAERLIDLQEQQMDTLEAIDSALRQEDEDDDEMDEEDEEDQASDEDDDMEDDEDEQAADEQSADDVAQLRELVKEQQETLDAIREGEVEIDTPRDDDGDEQADERDTATDDTDDAFKSEVLRH